MKLNKKGFTLVETLGVIVILAIIALIALPTLSASNKKSNDAYYSKLTGIVELAAKDYYIDNRTLLPNKQGTKDRVDISTLVRLDYIEQPKSVKNNNCEGYVEVMKNNELQYLTCLKCEDYISQSECVFP